MDHSKLLHWYEESARPFLDQLAQDRVAPLDNERNRLKRLLSLRDGITVCFIGNSGIGKSTLLNALAAGDRQVLPAGGIGPLTAQATEVHFSADQTFAVTYHKKQKLLQVGFALERRLERAAKTGTRPEASEGFSGELDAEDQQELVAEENDTGAAADGPTDQDPMEGYIKQARLLVTGDQFSDKPLDYLVDAIALACGQKARWGAHLEARDQIRVNRLQEVLEFAKKGKTLTRRQAEGIQPFMDDLKAHAAGFLSPLVRDIKVGWNSDLLEDGVMLVDLPGVGIAQDTYREITKRYVREQARAVILVVDRAGPTDATIDLLRSSGYWDRLVGAADDPAADPCHMLVAVTRVDDVANEEWAQTSHVPKEERPKKRDVFFRLVEDFRPRIRDQLRQQLARITPSENETVRLARETAVTHLLADMEVFPVSAPEYRRILAGDDDDRAFLATVETTGIPALAERLSGICKAERRARHELITEVSDRLARTILTELGIIEALWKDQGRAAAEAENLRTALEAILGPKEKEYTLRVGAFREFLESTVTTRIRELVLEAQMAAEAEVNNYLIELRNEHWATLRAAVRRGGVWLAGRGRAVNLPDDIATYFQEPMAAVWGQKLLKDIRKRTSELADDILKIVEELCDWARENGGTTINKEVLSRQHERIADQVSQLRQVGKEAVDELRDTVKRKLMDVVKKPIKKACDDFVDRGEHIGPGVKVRILELFEHLARQATKAVEKPAIEVLKTNFLGVRAEVRTAFANWGDPVADTANLIVQRHEDRVKRSDAQRRAKVLSELEGIISSAPRTDLQDGAA